MEATDRVRRTRATFVEIRWTSADDAFEPDR
jgi:hypothetical protein